jgi:cysteine desulfurase
MSMDRPIYLDNGATTPVDPRVVEAMLPFFTGTYGNPSSIHFCGREARKALEESRTAIAGLIHASPEELVFTGSGTEANNLAVKGTAFALRGRGNHVILSAVEHDSVHEPCQWLRTQGFEVTWLPVDGHGLVDPADLKRAIGPETILVSVIHANNEIGTVEPIGELGRICREREVVFHSDACQSFGKIPVDVGAEAIDLLTLNAHKIHGPKGVGALYVRAGLRISPWEHGGGQESGLRAATQNVAGTVGFARAAQLCFADFKAETSRLLELREKVVRFITERFPGAYLNGHPERRLPNNVNVGFAGYEGESIRLLLELDARGVAVSTGSACSANKADGTPSRVLTAVGRNPFQARGALRISLGRQNTVGEIDSFLSILAECRAALTSISTI